MNYFANSSDWQFSRCCFFYLKKKQKQGKNWLLIHLFIIIISLTMCTDGPLPAIDTNLCVGVWCVCVNRCIFNSPPPRWRSSSHAALSLCTKPETKQQKIYPPSRRLCYLLYTPSPRPNDSPIYIYKKKNKKTTGNNFLFCFFSNLKTKQLIRNNNNNKRIVRWKTMKTVCGVIFGNRKLSPSRAHPRYSFVWCNSIALTINVESA